MELKDNHLAAVVFITIMFTMVLYRLSNEPTGIYGYYMFRYTLLRIYINLIILSLCFISIFGLVRLLQMGWRSSK
jgi:hypothetical protein